MRLPSCAAAQELAGRVDTFESDLKPAFDRPALPLDLLVVVSRRRTTGAWSMWAIAVDRTAGEREQTSDVGDLSVPAGVRFRRRLRRRVWAWVVVGGGRVAALARAANTSPIIIIT